MAASPTSRFPALKPAVATIARWLCPVALLLIGVLAPATAGAVTPGASAQATANVTDATTGISDASSSVVPRNVCSAASPGEATCLAQYLALRRTRTPVHPHLRQAASPDRFIRRHGRSRGGPSALAVPAAAAPQPGTPAYLQQAYDLAYLSQIKGADQTVAVVGAFDNPTAQADLDYYRSYFGLRPCDDGCFQKVDQNGGTNYPPPPTNTDGSTDSNTWNAWRLETSLDLQAVSALCPNCHITLVEANTFSRQSMLAAQQEAQNLGATVISDSWRIVPTNPNQQTFFQNNDFAFAGISTVAASGDAGYLGQGSSDPACAFDAFTQNMCNSYPAAQSDVTAVGGTTLAPAGGARGFGETAWSWNNPATKNATTDGATGSGCNTTAAAPTGQTNTDCKGRAYNDISADGDPSTGMPVYYTPYQAPPGWVVVGGTSEAAPLVAAYYALLQSMPGGSSAISVGTPAWLYDPAQARLLNDPAAGSTGPCDPLSPVLCTSGSGWDGPTGAGSISGAVVTGAPGIGGPGPSGTNAQGVSTTGAQLQGGVYPNGVDTSYWWEYGTTTAYGQETPQVGIGSGTTGPPAVQVLSALNGLQPDTTYHYRLMAENSFGIVGGYDFTFTTSQAPPTTTTTPPPTTTAPAPTTTTPPKPTPPTTRPIITPPLPSAPSLGKLRILALGAGTATVSAAINAHGASTSYYLAYATTPALRRRTPSGSSSQAATATWHLHGLAAGRIYYLRVVATNAGGSMRTTVVRVKTSPVSLGKITIRGGKLAVVVRCHGSGACGVRMAARAGKPLIAAGSAKVRGNHSRTILLKLNRAAVTRARHGNKLQATLSAVSVWNGYAATVGATFRLALRA
jgi:hypothetical protein